MGHLSLICVYRASDIGTGALNVALLGLDNTVMAHSPDVENNYGRWVR